MLNSFGLLSLSINVNSHDFVGLPLNTLSLILSHNVRQQRLARGLSQANLAKKSQLSLRQITSLEQGKTNPTLNTIEAIAKTFQVSAMRLLQLQTAQFDGSLEEFVDRLRKAFGKSQFGVATRNLEGHMYWANSKLDEGLFGGLNFEKGPVDLFTKLSVEGKRVLKAQMAAEKIGVAHTYTLFHNSFVTDREIVFRCHPTIIYPKNSKRPILTVVFFSLVESDKPGDFRNYIENLLKIIND